MIQNEYEGLGDGSGDGDDDTESTAGTMHEIEMETESDEDGEAQPQLDPVARLAAKRANPALAPVMRSKGFCWLATRNTLFGYVNCTQNNCVIRELMLW